MIKEITKSMLSAVKMNPAIQGDVWDFFSNVSNYILIVSALVVAPFLFIAAAFYFFTAAGQTEKINRARNLIFWTVIGLIVILVARGLFAYLATIF